MAKKTSAARKKTTSARKRSTARASVEITESLVKKIMADRAKGVAWLDIREKYGTTRAQGRSIRAMMKELDPNSIASMGPGTGKAAAPAKKKSGSKKTTAKKTSAKRTARRPSGKKARKRSGSPRGEEA